MSDILNAGTLLGGRYEIIEKIGTGGMASVYKAYCTLLKRYVAVKVLHEQYAEDASFLEHFHREAQAAAGLNHQNIVSIYDVGSDHGVNYIVMELVEGITLKKYIEKHGMLEWREAVKFEMQILRALECAHAKKIVHHDIKPQNMLITEDGTLKVTDFGIARITGTATITAKDRENVVGSVHYCSPEQARGGFTDEKSDVYSAGVVLYEMLTGKVPFDAESPVAIAIMHMNETPEEPRKSNPDIPIDLQKVVFHAMSREKRNRYPSVTAMMADLECVMAGEPLSDSINLSNVEVVEPHRRGAAASKRETKVKKKNENSDKNLVIKSIVAAVLVMAVVTVGALYLFGVIGKGKEVEVPDVTTLSYEEAVEALEKLNLKVKISPEGVDPEAPYFEGEAYVVEQDPQEGSKLKEKHGEVTLLLGADGNTVAVPSGIINLRQSSAIAALQKVGFECAVETVASKGEKGIVKDCDPAPGTKAPYGSVVTIYVSTNEAKVPKIIGLTKAEAELKMQNAVLEAVFEEKEPTGGEAAGVVIGCDTAEGSTVAVGSQIKVYVSTGVPEKPEPQVEYITKKILVTIPQDKESTLVTIKANGKTYYEGEHLASEGRVYKEVSGVAGKAYTFEIYFDNALAQSVEIQF